LSLVTVFRAKVVDISHTQMIVEASGNKEGRGFHQVAAANQHS
jgi:acetolactate synthase small subunit